MPVWVDLVAFLPLLDRNREVRPSVEDEFRSVGVGPHKRLYWPIGCRCATCTRRKRRISWPFLYTVEMMYQSNMNDAALLPSPPVSSLARHGYRTGAIVPRAGGSRGLPRKLEHVEYSSHRPVNAICGLFGRRTCCAVFTRQETFAEARQSIAHNCMHVAFPRPI